MNIVTQIFNDNFYLATQPKEKTILNLSELHYV